MRASQRAHLAREQQRMATLSALELLQSAQAALTAEAAAVTAAREAVEADRVLLERERQSMGGATAVAGDVVTVNVGGTLFTTRRHTFTAARGSLLGAMFSGRWEESLSRDAAGHVFLDDDPPVFADVLAALRARAADSASSTRDPLEALEPVAEVMAFVDKYQLRDHIWPVPFGVTAVTSAGAAVCEVAVASLGRAVCISGGVQLPTPLQIAAPQGGPAQGQPFGFGAAAAPVNPFQGFNIGAAAPAAAGGRNRRVRRPWNAQQGPQSGLAFRIVPRSVFRAGPPLGDDIPPLPASFALKQHQPRFNGPFANALQQWVHETSKNKANGVIELTPATSYSVPLSNFTLTAITPGAFHWAITLRQLSHGAVLGVATAAEDVHGLLFLRDLHPWGADDAFVSHPERQHGHRLPLLWRFLPVLDGDAFLPEQLQVNCAEDALGPQLAYYDDAGLKRIVHEDCSLLFELQNAPHASSTTTCLNIWLLRDGSEDRLRLSKLCALPLPKTEAPWHIYVQPMPGNDVLLHHVADAIRPEPRAV